VTDARDPAPPTAAERLADHAAIDRLADELVPALIAKLSASGLGEIEVAEGDWTVRVRRPADSVGPHNRRATDRASRAQPGHVGHGHAPGGFEGHRAAGPEETVRTARTVARVDGVGPAGGIGATSRAPSDGPPAPCDSPAVGSPAAADARGDPDVRPRPARRRSTCSASPRTSVPPSTGSARASRAGQP
jgi:hypothetical protein